MDLEFKRKASREVLRTPVFTLREDVSAHPVTGREGRYVVLESPDWVNIVALTAEGEVLLVRQWRHGTRAVELELPAGVMEHGEDPVRTAARELEEETGYRAAKCTLLGSVQVNCAIQENRCFTVLAEGCVLAGPTRFDEGELLTVERVPAARLRSLVREGALRSGMMHVALLWWLEHTGAVRWPE